MCLNTKSVKKVLKALQNGPLRLKITLPSVLDRAETNLVRKARKRTEKLKRSGNDQRVKKGDCLISPLYKCRC